VSNYEDSYSDQAIYDKIIKARVKSLIHMPFFGILLPHLTSIAPQLVTLDSHKEWYKKVSKYIV
jgi:hypothetical protein